MECADQRCLKSGSGGVRSTPVTESGTHTMNVSGRPLERSRIDDHDLGKGVVAGM